MGLAPFNRIRQLAAQESDSGHPINAQQGAGLEREMEGLRQAELNKTRVLSKEELNVLQNSHLRDPYAEGQLPVEGGTPEDELIRALGSIDHNPAPVGSDMKFIEKLHEAAGKVEESKSDPEASPKRRGKASEQKPEAQSE